MAAILIVATLLLASVSTKQAAKSASTQSSRIPPTTQARLKASYASQPLAFEPNRGQTDSRVRYLARGRGFSLFLSSHSAYFSLPVTEPSHPAIAGDSQSALGSSTQAMTATEDSRRRPLAMTAKKRSIASVEMQMLGSNPDTQITAELQLPGLSNYILSSDPSKWQSGVPHYGEVRYHDIYPGVDLAFHGATQAHGTTYPEEKFEFDFLVNPGANPQAVTLAFNGAGNLRTNSSGDLLLTSAAGDIRLHRPFAYQKKNGIRQPVDARFALDANNRVSFALGSYDRSRQVVIDPTVTYSTYLGGSAEDDAEAIAVDGSGNIYVTGKTNSTDFPGTPTKVGSTGNFDVFVAEINAAGTLVFTTLVGGSQDDVGNAIAVDTATSSPGIYVGGSTNSTGTTGVFPTTSLVVQQGALSTATHGFVFKLLTNGSGLLWSTLVEGSDADSIQGLALVRDALNVNDDDVYVVGSTLSPDLGSNTPGHNGTVNPLPGGSSLNKGNSSGADDGFIAKVAAGGTQYLFLSYLGGSSLDVAEAVAVDSSGDVYVTGLTTSTDFPVTAGVVQATCGTDGTCNNSGGNVFDDAFVSAITAGNTPTFIYSTYLGGELKDDGFGIAVDSNKNAYITGQTFSTKFPTKNPITGLSTLVGTQNAFVASLNPTGTALNYSTYLGGSGKDAGDGIAVDIGGNAYVTGYTTSTNFPVASATQATFGGGSSTGFDTDAFVSELSLNGSSLSLPFSTYLGGSGDEDFVEGAIMVDGSGKIYVTGNTNSSNFPVTNSSSLTGANNCTFGGLTITCPDAFVTVYAPDTDFRISGTALASVNAGSSSTSTITITPFNGYTNTVNLTCSVSGGGTLAPTCIVSPASITGGSGTSTLTVQTTGPTQGTPAKRLRAAINSVWVPVGIVLVGGGLFGARSRSKDFLRWLLVGVLISGLVLLPSCGGGSSNNGGGGGSGGCTTAPSVPAGLAASGTTTTGTTLNWTADSAPSGCSISNYTVYQNGTSIGTPTTNTLAVTGLTPSTTYMFTVAASDAAGASAQSSAVSVTTGSSGTPAGTYTITVTGSDGTLTHSISPPLTITVN